MAPLNEEQLDQIKNERKVQIMNAAIKVFAENGVKLTKISMIAKEAKVSHGLVYHYFKSKNEILYKSLEWFVEENKGVHELQSIKEIQCTPLEKIKQFTKIAFTEGDGATTSNIFRIIQHLSAAEDLPNHLHQLVKNAGQYYIEFLSPLFAEGQRLGEIIRGDTEELLGIYLTVLSGIMAEDPTFWNENTEWKVEVLLRMISTR